jgi:hypothetical protein
MRLRALALVSFASLAVLAGCGDDGGDDSPEAQAFCAVVEPIQALPTALENPDDVEAVESTMTAAETALGQVSGTPPEGIADDVEVVTTRFETANAALKEADYDYNNLPADDESLNAILDPEFTDAADNIQSWASDNCD